MSKFRNLLAVVALGLIASSHAFADTINFTVTITSSVGPAQIPIGTVYTGSAHYEGSVDPNFIGYPPELTSFTFDFPGTPSSLSDMAFAFLQREFIGAPLFVELGHYQLGVPYGSYWLMDDYFQLFTTDSPGGAHYLNNSEYGTVAYSYVSDPVSSVPEPGTLSLLGTGVLGTFGFFRRRFSGRTA